MAINIASRWRQLSGEKNWEGLMNPLDLDLRRYIIHNGERSAAVGDLLNNDRTSNGFGHCLYPEDEFFSRAGLENGNIFKYSVIDFIYAGSDAVESAWFGYVAVTTEEGKVALGRRDILVALRGTATLSEWTNDADAFLIPATELFGANTKAKVHKGFLSLYTGRNPCSANNKTSAREQICDAIKELVNKYEDEDISITLTGHSLGAALATLSAMDIVFNGYNNKPTGNSGKSCMVTCFTYAGPRVGDNGLKEVFKTQLGDNLHLLRITNSIDPIPGVPSFPSYTHLGKEFKIETTKSPYLKDSRDIVPQVPKLDETIQVENFPIDNVNGRDDMVAAHHLEVYLHGVAGVQENDFHLEVDRDIVLINKHTDFLKKEYKVPPNWWDNGNRNNMIQMDNGHWKFARNV